MRRRTAITIIATLFILAAPALGTATFDHQVHEEDAELSCQDCHIQDDGGIPRAALMPAPSICLDCHEEDILASLPTKPYSHEGDYRHGHQFSAREATGDCALCHRDSEDCTLCHHGENVDFLAHGRNFLYEHALTRLKGVEDCASCHDTRSFCTDCHTQFGVEPGDHQSGNWNGGGHISAAKEDLNSCLQCHDGPEPVCTTCHE